MVMWIGADWDSEKCVVAYGNGTLAGRGTVERRPGAVRAFLGKLGDEEFAVGIESGDHLWAELWRVAGADVSVFDGRKARKFSESLHGSGARDDRRSAEDLLEMVQSPAHRKDANRPTPESARGLERLMRLCEDASKEVVRYENKLSSLLRQVHPAFIHLSKRSLKTEWGLRVLELAPTPACWTSLGREAQAAALKGTSRAKRAELSMALGDQWVPVDQAEDAANALHVKCLVQALRGARDRSKAAEAALAAAVAGTETHATLVGIKGLGTSLTAAITIGLAEDAGTNRDSLAVSLGAAPVTTRSGKRGDARPGVHMRRAAAPAMRRAGYLIGWQLVGNYRWAQAQYAACRATGKPAAAAYRRITRSFSRVITALIANQESFDEERYIAALKKNGVAWAMPL